MGKVTAIGWTTSTFNAWIGCTEISPGCDHCYARELDKRYRWGGATHWGAGVPRMRTATANWRQPILWNRQQDGIMTAYEDAIAEALRDPGQPTVAVVKPVPWRVFCSSLSDFADNEVPAEWQRDLEALIAETPYLDWLLVTKRIGNVPKLYPGWVRHGFPKNVRVIASVVNQEEADRDLPKLRALRCRRGVSYEPALGRIDWCELFGMWWNSTMQCFEASGQDFKRDLDWIIIGGESHQGVHRARPFHLEWARATVRQCRAAGVPVFVKQLGSHVAWDGGQTPEEHWPDFEVPRHDDTGHGYWRVHLKDRAGADPAEWPADLRVQQFPA